MKKHLLNKHPNEFIKNKLELRSIDQSVKVGEKGAKRHVRRKTLSIHQASLSFMVVRGITKKSTILYSNLWKTLLFHYGKRQRHCDV
jgi:hypothetical protein